MGTAPLEFDGPDDLDTLPGDVGEVEDASLEVAQAATAVPSVSFTASDVQPAAMEGVYINVNDTIQFTAWNGNLLITSLTAQLRILLPDGTIQISQLTIANLTSDRTPNIATLSQVEGFLVAAVVGPVREGVFRGQLFCTINIVRGAAPTQLTVMQLVADYATPSNLPTWPGGEIHSSLDGPGYVYTFAGTSGGAGAGWTIVMPSHTQWKVRNVQASLTTGAAVGTRVPNLSLENLGNFYEAAQPFGQAASLTGNYSWGAGVPYSTVAASLIQTAPLPFDLLLPEGSQIVGGCANEQAADDFSPGQAFVEEWIVT
jgi:hypothetical protein